MMTLLGHKHRLVERQLCISYLRPEAPHLPKGTTAYYNDKTIRRLAGGPCPLD
jgi:hypothetical protein